MNALDTNRINVNSPYKVWAEGLVLHFETENGIRYAVDFDSEESYKSSNDMATISLNPTLYSRAQDYAKADGMSVEEWVAMLITRFKPARKKTYKMKQIEELSPELQSLIGFAKPEVPSDDDINGDRARTEYLTAKYAQ